MCTGDSVVCRNADHTCKHPSRLTAPVLPIGMVGLKCEDEDMRAHVEAFPDLPCFLSRLEQRWSDVPEAFVARAPGRLDVMGGISDYSGGLVMQMPIKEACFAAVCLQSSPRIQITSFRQPGQISTYGTHQNPI